MNRLMKILAEIVISFFIGVIIMLGILVAYGIRYMIKFHTSFAFAINGKGTEVLDWTVLAPNEIIFIVAMGGLILVFIDLVFNIVKAIHR